MTPRHGHSKKIRNWLLPTIANGNNNDLKTEQLWRSTPSTAAGSSTTLANSVAGKKYSPNKQAWAAAACSLSPAKTSWCATRAKASPWSIRYHMSAILNIWSTNISRPRRLTSTTKSWLHDCRRLFCAWTIPFQRDVNTESARWGRQSMSLQLERCSHGRESVALSISAICGSFSWGCDVGQLQANFQDTTQRHTNLDSHRWHRYCYMVYCQISLF